MKRDSFVFYRSFYEAIRRQPKKVQADIYNAIAEYALNGNEPQDDKSFSMFYLIKPQIDANNQRYENGKNGGRPRKENQSKTIGFGNPYVLENQSKTKPKPNNNQNITKVEPNVNVNENANENKNENENVNVNGNEGKEKAPKGPKRKQAFSPTTLDQTQEAEVCFKQAKRFIPPLVDEVRTYCAERGNRVDAERFVDFYAAKGWMVGKNKMKDWKAAVRTWERQDAEVGASAKNSSNPFYDIGKEEGLF